MSKPFNPNDAYARKAKKDGFRARSAYKLQEIMERHILFKSGDTVLDVGASPGSWLQVVAPLVGPKGMAIGIDLTPIKPIAQNVKTLVGDITDQDTLTLLASFGPYDSIISDAAPNTSGIKIRDQAQSEYLVACIMQLAEQLLNKNGSLVMKIFQGSDLRAIQRSLKLSFKEVYTFKPKSSRDRSIETFLICLGKNH